MFYFNSHKDFSNETADLTKERQYFILYAASVPWLCSDDVPSHKNNTVEWMLHVSLGLEPTVSSYPAFGQVVEPLWLCFPICKMGIKNIPLSELWLKSR